MIHKQIEPVAMTRDLRLPGSVYRSGHLGTEASVAKAMEGLRPLVQMVEGAGAAAVPLAIPGSPGLQAGAGPTEARACWKTRFWEPEAHDTLRAVSDPIHCRESRPPCIL